MNKFLKCLLLGLLSVQIEAAVYRNQLGDCEPYTVEFIAGLVQRQARQFLQFFQPRPKRMLRFDLYTRNNMLERQILKTGDANQLAASHFNASWPVRFSIHGFQGRTNTCSNAAIKDAYLAKGNFNVVLIDWTDYALNINYLRVVTELFEMADQINEFASFLYRNAGVAYEDMYLIGHSLGCHLAGIAGKRLHPHKYGVIYALDCAGPILNQLNSTWRVAPTDALYVESIQTDLSLFGFKDASIGHATFFPNWGLGQPHCPNATAMEPVFVCDHFGSLYYFVESLYNGRAFGGYRCRSFGSIVKQKCGCGQPQCVAQVFMGGEPAEPKRGIYYLSTRPQQPFGYGEMCHMKRALAPTAIRVPKL